MARGKPAFWGLLVGIPIAALGFYTYSRAPDIPDALGIPFAVLGAFVVLTGLHVHRMAPEPMDFDEEVLAEFHPNQLAAKGLLAVGTLFFLVTIYLLYGTYVPYVYPTLSLCAFLGFTLFGLVRYWQNSLTTYYVTTEQITSEYRFLELIRPNIRLDDIAATGRRQSVIESLVGLGTIEISAGGGNPKITEIRFRDIEDPEEAEDVIDRAREQY